MTAGSSDIDIKLSGLLSLIQRSPEDTSLRLQLFEVLHANNRVDEFVLEALDYKASCGLTLGEIWDQICKMGREIDPENPIFSEARKTKLQPTQSGLPADPRNIAGSSSDSEPKHVPARSQSNTQTEVKDVGFDGPERRIQAERRSEDRRMIHMPWPEGERRKTTRRSRKRRSNVI